MENTRVTRRIRQGAVEVNLEESSVVVNFDIEVVSVGENGRIIEVLDSNPDSRKIKIKTLTPEKDLAQMSRDIIEKCKYIHPSRVEEVEQLLIQLRKHHLTVAAEEKPVPVTDAATVKALERKALQQQQQEEQAERETRYPPAKMDDIDEYLDMLYQVADKKNAESSLKKQIYGTAMILQLCRNVMNLDALIQNNTLMGALTRVFQEEFKKSVELTHNILRIFLAFSNFMVMHGLMSHYGIGLLTMKAIEFEFQRTEHREIELKQWEGVYSQELAEAKATKDSNIIAETLDKQKLAKENQKQKTHKLYKKQDKIFFVGFYILLNLAEDVSVERKMIKKGLIDLLLKTLDRTSTDLLIIAAKFLKKLSIYESNKAVLIETNALMKYLKFIPCSCPPLIQTLLRLLFNLSFDREFREKLVQHGIVPKLVQLLQAPPFRGRVLWLLYHLSYDDRCKSMFTYTDGIPLLLGMIVNFPQNTLTKEIAGLAVNLTLNVRNAEMMASNRGLNHLIDRLTTTKDPLLMKIIRNISLWTFQNQNELDNPELLYKHRGVWSPHVKSVCRLAVETDNHDLLVEILGTLANFTQLDLPMNQGWTKLLRDYQLLSLLTKLLVPGMAQNDVVLEVVMIIASAAADTKAVEVLVSSNFITMLYQLWKEKSSDVEILLQLMYCFYRFFQHEISREEALYSTRVVVDIIECLHHRNSAVRQLADTITELVLELDRQDDGSLGQLGLQIRKKRFESYNQRWLTEVGSAVVADEYVMESKYGSKEEDDEDYTWRALMRNREGLGMNANALDTSYDFGPQSNDDSADTNEYEAKYAMHMGYK